MLREIAPEEEEGFASSGAPSQRSAIAVSGGAGVAEFRCTRAVLKVNKRFILPF